LERRAVYDTGRIGEERELVAEVREVLTSLVAKLNREPESLQGQDAVYQLELTGPGGGSYFLSLRDGVAQLTEAADRPVTASVTLALSDFLALVEKRASAMGLFMTGKVRLAGDLGQALKLEALLR
jgi:putative sterol carrier protein